MTATTIARSMRSAYSVRLKTSRPALSVPKKWLPDGPLRMLLKSSSFWP